MMGVKINMLTFIRQGDNFTLSSGRVYRKIVVVCDCGNEKQVYKHAFYAKKLKSCGCINKSKNGFGNEPLCHVWRAMKQRTINEKSYIEKGISVCDEWMDYFKFKEWAMCNGYKRGLQIDRKDNLGDYEPTNCRWVTPMENAHNRATTFMVNYNGENKPLISVVRELGVDERKIPTIRRRISVMGWDLDSAINTKSKNY